MQSTGSTCSVSTSNSSSGDQDEELRGPPELLIIQDIVNSQTDVHNVCTQEPIPQLRHSYLRHEALAAALAAEPPPRPGAPSRPTLRHFATVASQESEHNVPVPGTVAPNPSRWSLNNEWKNATCRCNAV